MQQGLIQNMQKASKKRVTRDLLAKLGMGSLALAFVLSAPSAFAQQTQPTPDTSAPPAQDQPAPPPDQNQSTVPPQDQNANPPQDQGKIRWLRRRINPPLRKISRTRRTKIRGR